MNIDVLEDVKKLPIEKQLEVEDFISFLLSKYNTSESKESLKEKRMKNLGRMKGEIWMANDFNETPEDFKDYI
jgi:uncharacterized radical SAM superfamily Fe-S cluster-containing enzyme